jgi:hypothetical protein
MFLGAAFLSRVQILLIKCELNMSLKNIPTKLLTKGTRAPLLLWIYRSLLKNCIKLKKIDLVAGEWYRLEVMIQFRRNFILEDIKDINREYQNSLAFKSILQHAILNQHLESQKFLVRSAYGQTGRRKFEFLAAICFTKKEFTAYEEICKHDHYDVAIPQEYYDYMEKNKVGSKVYEGLFGPKFDFAILASEREKNKPYVQSLNVILSNLYKQERLYISLRDRNASTY